VGGDDEYERGALYVGPLKRGPLKPPPYWGGALKRGCPLNCGGALNCGGR
jgi:hypothetical protein